MQGKFDRIASAMVPTATVENTGAGGGALSPAGVELVRRRTAELARRFASGLLDAAAAPAREIAGNFATAARTNNQDYQNAMQGWRHADPPPGVKVVELDGATYWQTPDGRIAEPQRVNIAGLLPMGQNDQTGAVSLETGRLLPLVETAMAGEAGARAAVVPGRNSSVANSYRVGYNPPQKPPRPFAADYPAGAQTDDAGRLLHDIEGRPINPDAFIAGRRTAAGVDEALRPEELVEGAARLIGQNPAGVARSEIPGNSVGAFVKQRGLDAPSRRVLFDKSLPADHAQRVISHETGHAIDDIAGTIPTDGLKTELRQVYSTLATGQERGRNLTGPQHVGYKPSETNAELMAEAIRAYISDPNYLKTVAPNTAARIRAAVNADPQIGGIFQFNSAAPFLAMPLLGNGD